MNHYFRVYRLISRAEQVVGGNPLFITESHAILTKCYRILQYLIIWGFFNIPEGQCPYSVRFVFFYFIFTIFILASLFVVDVFIGFHFRFRVLFLDSYLFSLPRQKQIFEMQIANFQERCAGLKELLDKPSAEMSQIKTLDVSRALQKNVREWQFYF
jgi:hypothetical protein